MLRRVVVATAVYLLAAAFVLGVGVELARLLVLPPLFLTLLAAAAVLGLPLTLLLAWRYRPPCDP